MKVCLRALAGLLLGLTAAVAGAVDASIPGLSLEGEWRQGSPVFGRVPAGAQVWFNGRALRVSEDGRFVFGLHRDEGPAAELRVRLPGEAQPRVLKAEVLKREYAIQRISGLPPKMVSPPPEVQQRIAEEQRLVARARDRNSALSGFAEAFIWPSIGPISGVFGSQRILNGEPKQPHYGVDVAVPTGTPVRAPASGVVSLAHPDMYYTGGTLMIDHGHGLSSAFLHLSKLHVKEGQTVKQGDLIGAVGATGRATGPHLDWRVNWFDARVDAQLLVPPMPSQK